MQKQIKIWLLICCFMIFIMVVIGGLTRLTNSGLSMTRWEPVTGFIPPFNETAWQEEFDSYKQSPEYEHINYGMDLHEFKEIFWLEFIHRVFGRLTGFVFLIPLIYFIIKGAIDKKFAMKLGGVFVLGGLQGLIGWLMVSSGLKDVPYVSHYWLAFHLFTAFFIFTLIFLLALSLDKNEASRNISRGFKLYSLFIPVIILIQVVFGAFVAGLDAGLVYNTFPLMDGKIIPDEIFMMTPWYANFLENIPAIQWLHRMFAFFVTGNILIFWALSRKYDLNYSATCAIKLLVVFVAVQFGLGVLTLIYSVPVLLASAHQAMAMVLYTCSLFVARKI